MSYGNHKAYAANVNPPKVPFLPVYATQNGKRFNERKAKSLKLAKIYYNQIEKLPAQEVEAMKKRAGRVWGCSSSLLTAISDSGYMFNLASYRCKDRNCVSCQRIRAFILQQKVREISPSLIEQTDKKDGLIFGTLTVKNPLVSELKDYLKIMSKAFTRLMRRKEFARVAVGGFRCFEVTRGQSGADFCHPHIHFLLQVRAEYFKRNSKIYLKSEDWARAWTDCLRLEVEKSGRIFNPDDYPNGQAFVKILRVQASDSTRENRKYATIESLKNDDRIINYVLKYTAKSDEDGKKGLVKDDPFFFEYDRQIKNIRAISFFGIYKKLLSELPPREYQEQELKDALTANKARFFDVQWDDDHRYLAHEITEAVALEKKRIGIVGSIKKTLCEQLKHKYRILDEIIKQLDKKDFLKVQQEINSHNILSPRIFEKLLKLERTGEIIKIGEDFKNEFYNYFYKSDIYKTLPDLITAEELEKIKAETMGAIEIIEDDPPF